MLEQIEQSIHNLLYDHKEGLWSRYKRWKLSEYDIPLNDMGNSGKTDSNGNLYLECYQNRTQRDLVIAAFYLWADGYTPASVYLGGGSTWCGFFPDRNMGPGTMKDALPFTPQGQIFPQIGRYNKHSAPRFKSGENVWFCIVNGPATTNITVKLDGWLKPTGADEDRN